MKLIYLFLVFFSVCGFAEPYRYVLEGDIRSIDGDDTTIDNLNISVGDYVRYVLLIDTAENGYTDYSGEIECHEDYLDENESRENFYAELLEISYKIGDTYYGFENTNYTASTIDSPTYPDGPFTRLTVGPELLYFDSTSPIETWEAGEVFGGAHLWHDAVTEEFHTMHLNLELIEIEPSALFRDHSLCIESNSSNESVSEEGVELDTSTADSNSGGGGSVSLGALLFLVVCIVLKNMAINRVKA